MAPVLSALADGEATSAQLAEARPHLRTCLACRARLAEYREVPARVAALVPPAALVASAGDGGGVRALVESAHHFTELAAGQKAAAVAASAAAIAGGGVASVDGLAGRPIEPASPMKAAPRAKVSEPPAPPVVMAPPAEPEPPVVPSPAPAAQPQAVREEARPAREFAPAAAAPAPAPSPTPAGGEFGP